MTKAFKIVVKGFPIRLLQKGENLFLSLTDMTSGFAGGDSLVETWLCKPDTLTFLALWEQLHNPDFRSSEAQRLRSAAGRYAFNLPVKEWITKTGAVGLARPKARHQGVLAQPDIAFEFASWLGLEFKVLLLQSFEQFKITQWGAARENWDLQRQLSKANYKMQARAIKESILPTLSIPKGEEGPVYAEEGDMLNLAVFGKSSQEWKEANPALARKGFNVRDTADLSQLTVLSNLASYNALLIRQNLPKEQRLLILEAAAVIQLQSLREVADFSSRRLQSPHAKEAA